MDHEVAHIIEHQARFNAFNEHVQNAKHRLFTNKRERHLEIQARIDQVKAAMAILERDKPEDMKLYEYRREKLIER